MSSVTARFLILTSAVLVGACASTSNVTARPEAFPRAGGYAGRPEAVLTLPVSTPGLIATARLQLGVRYHFGGASPVEGFDCSGLVRYVFQLHGVLLPRTTAEQFRSGIEVDSRDVSEGDLVFFSTTGSGPTHVGIVTHASTFVHAPDTGSVVREERFDTPYWSSRFLGIRRQATSIPTTTSVSNAN